MALAALGAAAVLDDGATMAEAAPSVSPFAGTYAWSSWPAAITISKGGRITSSFGDGGDRTKGSISGEVGDDGSYSFTVIVTTASYDDGPRDPRVPRSKQTYTSAGTMTLDADGNIVGTLNTGGSFVWVRQ